jgi:flagellar biosynthesis protein FlhG
MIGQIKRIVELQTLGTRLNYAGNGNIIAFTSGKGGVGKTVLSLNLAYQLSTSGKRILFADLDMNYANAHILLNLTPSKTVKEYLEGKILLNNIVLEVSKNLFLLPGNSSSLKLNERTNYLTGSLISDLKKISSGYDYLFIDTGQINDPAQMEILLNVDSLVIVTSPEPTAVMDAYVIIKMLKQKKSNVSKYVIVNKCSDQSEANITFNNLNTAVEHFLNEKLKMMGYINYDYSVHESILTQRLLLKEYSNPGISRQFTCLSDSLTEYIQVANIHHPVNLNYTEMSLKLVK